MAVADATINIVAHDKTQKAFKSVDNNLNRTSDALKGLAKRFIFAAGAAGIGGFVKQTINAADRLDKLSKRLDIGVSALSEYEHVANIGGVSFETLTMGMQRLTRRVAEASNGFGEAKGALRELNLDASELNKMPLDQKFEIVADALMGLTSESDRVRLAMKLFDSEGVALIQTMEGGAEGIRKVRDQAKELGLTISKETATAAANFNDEMTNLTGAIQGLANEALPTLLPLLTDTVDALKGGIQFIKDWATEIKFVALAVTNLFIVSQITKLIIGMKAAMAAATITARGLGLAISGMLGGIPGLLTLAGTAFFYFGMDLDGNTKKLKDNEKAISDLRYEYTQFSKIQITDSISRITGEMTKLELSIKSAKKQLENLTSEVVTGDEAMEGLQNVLENTTRDELKQMEDAFADLGIELQIAKEALKNLEEAQNAASRSMTVVEDQTQKAKTAMDKYAESLENAEFEASLLAEKNMLLDEMFYKGAISAETYYEQIDKLNGSLYKADEASKELAESTESLKDIFAKTVDDIRGAWTTMWEGLFSGKGIESVKDFLKEVKNIFLKTFAEIAAKVTWDAIFGKLTGGATGGINIVDALAGVLEKIFNTSGDGGGISKILSGIGAAISKIFGSATSSGIENALIKTASGEVIPAAGTAIGQSLGGGISSGISTVISGISKAISGATSAVSSAASSVGAAASSAMGSSALASAASAAPLIGIALFGFLSNAKYKKWLKGQFRDLMNNPEIVGNLASESILANEFVKLGEHAGQTYIQVGETAAKVLGELATKSLGLTTFQLKGMKDEFGNVIVTAKNFSQLMEIVERQGPFVKQAEELRALHGDMTIAKEGIQLVNRELFEADLAYAKMGQSGVDALMKINTKSNEYETIMQKGFVTATQMAKFGLEGFGHMSAEVFDMIVRGVQDSEDAMESLAKAAQIAIDKGRQAANIGGGQGAGRQHGGSWIVPGGSGGTDSQLVSFMATPGERVTVETPNQQRASGSDGGGVVKELRALRADLANVVAKPIVGAVSRGQLAMAGMGRH